MKVDAFSPIHEQSYDSIFVVGFIALYCGGWSMQKVSHRFGEKNFGPLALAMLIGVVLIAAWAFTPTWQELVWFIAVISLVSGGAYLLRKRF